MNHGAPAVAALQVAHRRWALNRGGGRCSSQPQPANLRPFDDGKLWLAESSQRKLTVWETCSKCCGLGA